MNLNPANWMILFAAVFTVAFFYSSVGHGGATGYLAALSLIGVAPFDRDSGQHKGQRFISGGRARPRRLLYIAALAAKRCDPSFKAFADRLVANGKPPKLAIVAVMRKLIEAANLVLQRGQPWLKHASA